MNRPVAPPSDARTNRRSAVVDPVAARSLLQQLDGLRGVPDAELDTLAGICQLRAFRAGAAISVEHAVPQTLFIILQGTVSLTLDLQSDRQALVSILGRGDVFGEGGIFGMRYRRVSARAENQVYVLQLTYAEVRPRLPEVPAFHRRLRELFSERLLQTALAKVPILRALTPIERLLLSADVVEHQFERGVTIVTLSGAARSLYLLAEGQAVLRIGDRPFLVFGPGDLCGEIEFLPEDQPEGAIVALNAVRLLEIPIGTMRQLIHAHPEIGRGLQELTERRYEAFRDADYLATMAAVVTSGLHRGHKALARVPALCPPDCHLCEDACGRRFGAPRIHLNGTQFGSIDLPRGCRHCAWSPECVEGCPEDALRLDDAGFLYVTESCTGCGACAEACPYDAIDMIPLYAPVAGVVDWLKRRVHQPPPLRLHANKCDGCHGYDDQTCLSACPTGSLRWISAAAVLPHDPMGHAAGSYSAEIAPDVS